MALYDPNEFPEAEVVNGFTLAEFLDWARTKPADEEYDFCDPSACAVAQFGIAAGRRDLDNITTHEMKLMCPGAYDAVHPLYGGWTFGALVERLESALA